MTWEEMGPSPRVQRGPGSRSCRREQRLRPCPGRLQVQRGHTSPRAGAEMAGPEGGLQASVLQGSVLGFKSRKQRTHEPGLLGKDQECGSSGRTCLVPPSCPQAQRAQCWEDGRGGR